MNSKVSVSLDSVLCMATEDSTRDEFYVAGAVLDTPDGKTITQETAVLTAPLSMHPEYARQRQSKCYQFGFLQSEIARKEH